jgi:hypothetical protein
VDAQRLSRGERIAGAAAVLLLVDMFLSWYSSAVSSASANAWQAFGTTDILIFLTCLAAVAMVGLTVMGRTAGVALSVPMVVAALGGLTTLIILYRIANQPGSNDAVNVDFGAYLGLALAAALTYGAITASNAIGDPAPPPPAPDPAPPPPAPDPAPPPPAPDPEPPAPPPDPSPPQPGDDPMGPTA